MNYLVSFHYLKKLLNKSNMVNIIKKIKREIKPILKCKSSISMIYIYGSFVRQLKEKKKDFNDIDILVVLDDFDCDKNICREVDFAEVESLILNINKTKKINLHFQPVKRLSAWWRAVIKGEPWILTSLRDCYVLYDGENIIKKIKSLIKLEKTYNREEKAEELIISSDDFELENRRLLLDSINTLSNIATEAAQIYLLMKDKVLLDKDKIAIELDNGSMKKYSGTYKEIIDLESKVRRGFLSEFTAQNLDYYLEEISKFIEHVEKELAKP